MAYPRALTDAEWNVLHPAFPALVRAACRATAPANPVYNCIAWTLGITWTWVSPPPTIPRFIGLYNALGYVQCPANEALIDGWANNNVPTHGSIQYAGGGGTWESKMGEYIRIEHDRNALGPSGASESLYGAVVISFKRAPDVAEASGLVTAASVPTVEGVDLGHLDKIVATLSSKLQADDFDRNYDSWKKTWFSGSLALSSVLEDRAKGPEWTKLISMGPSILPKIVDKLKNAEDEFAVLVYNKLQTDTRKKVSPDDYVNYYILKNQAAKIRQLYGGHVLTPFLAKASEWETHQASSTSGQLDHDSYRALVGMGKDEITPLVMAKYAEDQSGRWHDLLTELHTGKKPEGVSVNKKEEYEKWKKWYAEWKGEKVAEAAPAA